MRHLLVAAIAMFISTSALAAQTAKSIESGYQSVWTDSGVVTFLRVVSDTSVMRLEVRYALDRAQTYQSVYYTLYSLKCPNPSTSGEYRVAMMELSAGLTESMAFETRHSPNRIQISGGPRESKISSIAWNGCDLIKIQQTRNPR